MNKKTKLQQEQVISKACEIARHYAYKGDELALVTSVALDTLLARVKTDIASILDMELESLEEICHTLSSRLNPLTAEEKETSQTQELSSTIKRRSKRSK